MFGSGSGRRGGWLCFEREGEDWDDLLGDRGLIDNTLLSSSTVNSRIPLVVCCISAPLFSEEVC